MNKKAMELSMNFIVILILSIVIFAGGLALSYKFFGKAQEYRTSIDSDTEAQIERILSSGETVAIPRNRKDIRIGESYVFGLGVFNGLGHSQDFYISMAFDEAFDTATNSHIEADGTYINDKWIFGKERKYTIDNNDHEKIGLFVQVDDRIKNSATTTPGTYIFNVCICTSPCAGDGCSTASATGMFYDSHVQKIYVTVP